jgi:hypothetical protein
VSARDPEKRQHTRYAVSVTVDVEGPTGLLRCEAENLAPGGSRIQSPSPLPVGTDVRVRIRSPRVDFEVAGGAMVAWSSGEPPHRIGLAFAPELVEPVSHFLGVLLGPAAVAADD